MLEVQQIAKEITIAFASKIYQEMNEGAEMANETLAQEVAKFYTTIFNAVNETLIP